MTTAIGRSVRRPAVDSGSTIPPVSSPVFQENWPDLWKFLAMHRGSGQNASTGTMTFFVEQNRWKVCLNDRPNGRSAFVTSTSMTACLGVADVGIRTSQIKWRKKGYKSPQNDQKSFLQS